MRALLVQAFDPFGLRAGPDAHTSRNRYCAKPLCGRGVRGDVTATTAQQTVLPAQRNRLRSTLLLQLLYPTVVIVGDCRSERHSARHPDLG